jgi:hypothetical protein
MSLSVETYGLGTKEVRMPVTTQCITRTELNLVCLSSEKVAHTCTRTRHGSDNSNYS